MAKASTMSRDIENTKALADAASALAGFFSSSGVMMAINTASALSATLRAAPFHIDVHLGLLG